MYFCIFFRNVVWRDTNIYIQISCQMSHIYIHMSMPSQWWEWRWPCFLSTLLKSEWNITVVKKGIISTSKCHLLDIFTPHQEISKINLISMSYCIFFSKIFLHLCILGAFYKKCKFIWNIKFIYFLQVSK